MFSRKHFFLSTARSCAIFEKQFFLSESMQVRSTARHSDNPFRILWRYRSISHPETPRSTFRSPPFRVRTKGQNFSSLCDELWILNGWGGGKNYKILLEFPSRFEKGTNMRNKWTLNGIPKLPQRMFCVVSVCVCVVGVCVWERVCVGVFLRFSKPPKVFQTDFGEIFEILNLFSGKMRTSSFYCCPTVSPLAFLGVCDLGVGFGESTPFENTLYFSHVIYGRLNKVHLDFLIMPYKSVHFLPHTVRWYRCIHSHIIPVYVSVPVQ